MSGKDPEKAAEDADKTGGQKVHHLSGRFAWSCQENGDYSPTYESCVYEM